MLGSGTALLLLGHRLICLRILLLVVLQIKLVTEASREGHRTGLLGALHTAFVM